MTSMKMTVSPLQLPGYRSSINNDDGGGVVGLQALLLADTAASLLLIHHHDHHHHHHHHQNNLLVTKSLTAALLPSPLPSSSSVASPNNCDNGNYYRYTSSTVTTSSYDEHDDGLLLQSCHFCSTKLSPKKDVYIYRGDQGFCSRQCREKQMKLDELKEMEESTLLFHLKNSYHNSTRHRRGPGQLQVAPLLEIGSSSSSSNASVSSTASRHQGDHGSSISIPRRRNPISQHYYNRPLPHQRRLVHHSYKHRR